MDQRFEQTAFYPADILLPQTAEMKKWPVVACDQFTSQPDYWQAAEAAVGEAPSALRLVLPEVYLNGPDVDKRIETINAFMDRCLADGQFRTLSDSLIYLERTQSDGRVRHGLIGCVDLEQYDFTPGSGALIRATEGTVLERIPPRVRVREHAALELPHVMLLADDPGRTVIEPLSGQTAEMRPLYDFDLMERGGHIRGWELTPEQWGQTARALAALADPDAFNARYRTSGLPVMLFAVGDGNHSLATAKECYERQKKLCPPEQWDSLPARYALVELNNLHDDSLEFEPIHRVVFGADPEELLDALAAFYPGSSRTDRPEGHRLAWVARGQEGTVSVPQPSAQLPVGTLQHFLDEYLLSHPGARVDYIHGEDVVRSLAAQPDTVGFLLPAMGKEELFPTVIHDGVLPRKTFSMGEAHDKRFYLEARRIRV